VHAKNLTTLSAASLSVVADRAGSWLGMMRQRLERTQKKAAL
jgi:hypothetical protein